MCCRYYSAKYLYPTFRLAANDGGGKASLKHKGPRNLRTRGPILCAQADLTAIQRALVRDCGCGHCVAAAAGYSGRDERHKSDLGGGWKRYCTLTVEMDFSPQKHTSRKVLWKVGFLMQLGSSQMLCPAALMGFKRLVH